MPKTEPKRRWCVIDDSGHDDCVLGSFVAKNEAVAFAKQTIDDPSYEFDSVTIICETNRSKDSTYSRTAAQQRAGLEYEAAADVRVKEIAAAAKHDRESGFYWQNGWYFKRMDDGSVRMTKLNNCRGVDLRVVIPPKEWASIVCSVSNAGETLERWLSAQAFHGVAPSPATSEAQKPEREFAFGESFVAASIGKDGGHDVILEDDDHSVVLRLTIGQVLELHGCITCLVERRAKEIRLRESRAAAPSPATPGSPPHTISDLRRAFQALRHASDSPCCAIRDILARNPAS